MSSTSTRNSLDEESEMLPQDPPPWIIRGMGWLLLGGFLFALLIAIVMRMPETVRCPFVLVPENGADPIQSPRQAVINKVTVSEGKSVKAGEELFVLRSDEIRGWDTQLQTFEADLRNREESLVKNDVAYAAQLDIKKAEIEQAKSEVKFRESHAATSRDLADRMEKVAKRGGVSEVELVRTKLDLAGSEKDFSVSQRALQQVILDQQRMEAERAKQRGEELAEIEKLKMRVGGLKGDLENTKLSLLTIRSPYDGIVTSVDQRTPGSIVTQGQILCQLCPLDAKPHARMTLSETGLPKLVPSQRIRYFMEAFPYQRYGAINGKLEWVSQSAVTTGATTQFVASGSLEKTTISPRPGQVLPLRVGMKGEAHIVTGRRTLIEYAFEPIRQLSESMSQ
jgi:multidrug efflux pump subunit AcrA (membrane-fusion protein)